MKTDGLTGLTVVGDLLYLCTNHRQLLGEERPENFDDLASFFAHLGSDRRQRSDRRQHERRLFPPRPEGRRHNRGRRQSDPKV